MHVNVPYLGMAYDIIAPLLLVSDLDTLYLLNLLAYGTWAEHKDRIRKVLFRMDSARHGCVQPPDSPADSEDSCTSYASEEDDNEPRITIVVPEQGS